MQGWCKVASSRISANASMQPTCQTLIPTALALRLKRHSIKTWSLTHVQPIDNSGNPPLPPAVQLAGVPAQFLIQPVVAAASCGLLLRVQYKSFMDGGKTMLENRMPATEGKKLGTDSGRQIATLKARMITPPRKLVADPLGTRRGDHWQHSSRYQCRRATMPGGS